MKSAWATRQELVSHKKQAGDAGSWVEPLATGTDTKPELRTTYQKLAPRKSHQEVILGYTRASKAAWATCPVSE